MPDPPLRQLDEPYWVWTSPSTGAPKPLHPASSEGEELFPEDKTEVSHDGLGAAIPPPDSSRRQLDEPLRAWTPPSTGTLKHQHPETSEEEEEFYLKDISTHPEHVLQRAMVEVYNDLLSEEVIYGLIQPLSVGDGLLSVTDIEDTLMAFGICPVPQCWQILMDKLDVDRSGNIDYSEFLAATIEARRFRDEEVSSSTKR
ncbi:unnamed protein product [Polarella glacialis]|uniref:EF-hand domain-containing protein n=1 Tax=Polarella glacialis TaxID=89957 RepID=A0A813LRP5_POLGL|nr:unnamed protein product [Polarella glacialis]